MPKGSWLNWWLRLVAKRFGYFMALSLLAWPLLTIIPALQSILSNVMLLDSYPQLFFFTFNNVIACFFSTAILRVLYSRYPSNSWLHKAIGDGATPWGVARIWGVTTLAVITPILLATAFGTEFETPEVSILESLPVLCSTMLCVTLSAVAAVFFLWLLGRFKSLFVGSKKETLNFFPFEAFDCKGVSLLSNLIEGIDRKLQPLQLSSTDVQLGVYLVLLAILHRGLLPLIEGDRYFLSSAPSAIVLLLWVSGMVLSGMAQLLDRLRIPVIVTGGLILTVIFAVVGSTRPFRSFKRAPMGRTSEGVEDMRSIPTRSENGDFDPGDDLPWQAIGNRMNSLPKEGPGGKGRTLVIVTCPGGGIHAASWAACVLDKLCEEYEGFDDSLCVISGVSGGSVGALMFVASRYEDNFRDAMITKTMAPSHVEITNILHAQSPALELASRSSLEAISFGTTVDDLYGLFGFPRIDRGERLERDFQNRLSEAVRQKTLGEWGEKALAGSVPIVVFNATDAVTGRRVLFDSIPTPTPNWEPSRNRNARPLNYRDLLADSASATDVLPATAARISATFPYVSPFTKPEAPSAAGQQVALCDGGYADNEGVVTAVTWIDYLLTKWAKKRAEDGITFNRILLLRIEPALSIEKDLEQKRSDPLSFVRWLIGPLETMMNVRSTSQLERGNLEADLVETYLDMTNLEGDPQKTRNLREDRKGRLRQRNQVDDAARPMQEVRKEWNLELEEMIKQFKDESSSISRTISPPPAPKATVGGADHDGHVIVESIRFRDADQAIPLSWKLSKTQKLWYLLSWKKIDELNPNLRPTLDKFFPRK